MFFHTQTKINKKLYYYIEGDVRRIVARDIRYDSVRAIACVFIVVTHILQGYGQPLAFWLNSAVCTFFLLAGILASKSSIHSFKWIQRRLFKTFPGYYICVIPMLILFSVVHQLQIVQLLSVLTNLSGIITVPRGFGHLWFMTGIVLAYVFTPLMRQEKWKGSLLFSCLILGLFLVGLIQYTMVFGLFCYILGVQSPKIFTEKNAPRYLFSWLIFLLFIGVNSVFFYNKWFAFVRYPLLGLLLFYIIYHSSEHLKNTKITSLIFVISEYSFFIYLVHGFFALGPFSLLNFFNIKLMSILLFILVTGLASILVKKGTEQLQYWLAKKLDKK